MPVPPSRRPPSGLNRRVLLASGLLAPALLPAVARAQGTATGAGAWPTRSVTIVEGYPPGGVTDITSRVVAERMARELGQPVVVDNRPGAATSVAATSVARARPDGYTLLMGTTTLAINQTLQPTLTPREPAKELDPIGMVFKTSFILHVHPSVPATNVPEFIAWLRANPGRYAFGSPGVGSVSHLCLELFKAQAGVDFLHVPYRGGGAAALDLGQGRVQAVFQGIQEALPLLRAGQTRGIGVSLRGRNPDFPDLAPVADALPGFGEVTFWQGLFAPAGTPAPILAQAGTALRAATADPALRARMAEQGVELLTGDADTLRSTLASETERWGGVIRAANIRVE